jgi:hypothetical protein
MTALTKRSPFQRLSGGAHTFGWLKRPELGTERTDVWEEPDGALHVVPAGREPVVTALRVLRSG